MRSFIPDRPDLHLVVDETDAGKPSESLPHRGDNEW